MRSKGRPKRAKLACSVRPTGRDHEVSHQFWTLAVSPSGEVVGDAQQDGAKGPDAAVSHFELKRDAKRYKGRGARSYNATVQGKVQRCSISYDALLVRIDS